MASEERASAQQDDQPSFMSTLLPTTNLNGALFLLRIVGVVTAVLAFLMGFFYYTISVYTFVLVYLIRVWQRIGRPELSRAFLTRLLSEDAGHYLLYCLLITSIPDPISLVPLVLYAVLAVASTLLKACQASGSMQFLVPLATKVTSQSQSLFGSIASFEIVGLLMAAIRALLAMSLSKGFRVMALMQFNQLRYYSRRNPYPKAAWDQIRAFADRYTGGRVSQLLARYWPTRTA
eukprot:m.19078 g.19078  ORF g.19078 m.19078 type:complete len:234 (-) comp10893_c0_seq2:81-782(-)